MNIYDCFMYFDEDMLLDLRLNVLNDHVKKFIISEATYTHNGSPKKLNFDIIGFTKIDCADGVVAFASSLISTVLLLVLIEKSLVVA